MKKENNFMYILRLTVTLLAITACVAAALAGVNLITKDKIAEIAQQKTLDAIAAVLPGVEGLEEVAGNTGIVGSVYASGDSYAVEVRPSGFDGEVTMMVGITDGQVQGISIISHTETPGLGAVAAAKNAKGEAFRSQFEGVSGVLAVNKDGGEIDAITSATITSRAVVAGVNAALEYVENLG